MGLIYNGADQHASAITFGKSRGTAVGSDTAVANGDELGVILFNAADGTDRASQGAAIIATINGTPGGNDIPTMFRFQVCADGSASTTERFRIDQNGDLLGTDTSIGSLSDSRLKENVADYTYSIDTFKQLAPKTFTWKNPGEHQTGTRRGFTAQDVESVDRKKLLGLIKKYLEHRNMLTDWDIIQQTSTEQLINYSGVLVPFTPEEKQLLLESSTITERCSALEALYQSYIFDLSGEKSTQIH